VTDFLKSLKNDTESKGGMFGFTNRDMSRYSDDTGIGGPLDVSMARGKGFSAFLNEFAFNKFKFGTSKRDKGVEIAFSSSWTVNNTSPTIEVEAHLPKLEFAVWSGYTGQMSGRAFMENTIDIDRGVNHDQRVDIRYESLPDAPNSGHNRGGSSTERMLSLFIDPPESGFSLFLAGARTGHPLVVALSHMAIEIPLRDSLEETEKKRIAEEKAIADELTKEDAIERRSGVMTFVGPDIYLLGEEDADVASLAISIDLNDMRPSFFFEMPEFDVTFRTEDGDELFHIVVPESYRLGPYEKKKFTFIKIQIFKEGAVPLGQFFNNLLDNRSTAFIASGKGERTGGGECCLGKGHEVSAHFVMSLQPLGPLLPIDIVHFPERYSLVRANKLNGRTVDPHKWTETEFSFRTLKPRVLRRDTDIFKILLDIGFRASTELLDRSAGGFVFTGKAPAIGFSLQEYTLPELPDGPTPVDSNANPDVLELGFESLTLVSGIIRPDASFVGPNLSGATRSSNALFQQSSVDTVKAGITLHDQAVALRTLGEMSTLGHVTRAFTLSGRKNHDGNILATMFEEISIDFYLPDPKPPTKKPRKPKDEATTCADLDNHRLSDKVFQGVLGKISTTADLWSFGLSAVYLSNNPFRFDMPALLLPMLYTSGGANGTFASFYLTPLFFFLLDDAHDRTATFRFSFCLDSTHVYVRP
jgi:hypothetical protein